MSIKRVRQLTWRNKVKIKESLFWKFNPGSQQGVRPLFIHYQRAPHQSEGPYASLLHLGWRWVTLEARMEPGIFDTTAARPSAACSALLCSQYSEAQRRGGLQAAEGSTNFLPLTFADPSAKTLFPVTPETRVVCSRRVCSGGHVYPGLRTHLTHPFLPVLILVGESPPVMAPLS